MTERTMSDPAFDALVDAYYIDNPAGGNLHVVLDEGGTSDNCLLMCLGYAAGHGDDVGTAIAREMLRMPEDDRKAYMNFMDARAAARGRGEATDPYGTFSADPPVIRG